MPLLPPAAHRSFASATLALTLLLLGAGCQHAGDRDPATDRAAVAAVLDELHARAAAADHAGYMALYHADAVFLGTDRTEYWPRPEFERYTRQRFSGGTGWTYVPTERFVHVRDDVAWFEERVVNARYGETRGTGVLIFDAGRWQIAQYNLTLPIPNDLFDQVAKDVFNYYRR